MRAIYLIARREYLSYVATWGFWLSLLSVPLFMVLGGSIPFLVESSQPTRYYTRVLLLHELFHGDFRFVAIRHASGFERSP